MLRPSLFAATCSSLCIAFASPARAEDVAGTFRLSAGGTVLAVDQETIESDSGDVDGQITDVGLMGNGYGVGLAVAANDTVVAGARLSFASRTTEVDGTSSKASEIIFAPRVEALLGAGGAVPYLVGTLGYRTLTSDAMTSKGFMGGAGFGIHGFPQRGISIDPEVLLLATSSTVEFSGLEASSSGFAVVGGITLSAWLGGSERASSTVDSREERVSAGASETSEAVTPDAPHKPPPPPRNVVLGDQHGGVTMDTGIGAIQVRLVGRPKTHGDIVSVEVRLPGTVSSCQGAAFELGDRTLPASSVRLKATSSLLTIWSPSSLLEVIGHEGDVRFVACQRAAKLTKANRKAITKYLREFRRIAEKSGTWSHSDEVSVDVDESPSSTALDAGEPIGPSPTPAPEAPADATVPAAVE